jgi:hypothetical protein
MKILGKIQNQKLSLSDYNRRTWNDYLKDPEHDGRVIAIMDRVPESRQFRAWFEGALIPLITFYQGGMDYRSPEDNRRVREWILQEFNSEGLKINGKVHLVRKTSKGELNNLTERILGWMTENGYQTEVLNVDEFKRWRDELSFDTNFDNYIEYLVSIKRLKK